MKHLLLIPLLAILLVSCSSTPEERLVNFNAMKPVCDAQNRETAVDSTWAYCSSYKDNTVSACIDKYIESIDEKYNNPDTVSQLQDSNFSEAVKTCNEVFGKTK